MFAQQSQQCKDREKCQGKAPHKGKYGGTHPDCAMCRLHKKNMGVSRD